MTNSTGTKNVLTTLIALVAFASSTVKAFEPSPGLWWQAGANGKFMQLQIGPGGYAFVSLTFDNGGEPTYRVMQGQLRELGPGDAPALVELASPLYRIDSAGCLDCTDANGITSTVDSRSYRLRFQSGNLAQLQTADGQLVDYEYFPLYTRSADLTANRLAGKRAVLENRGHSVLVDLQPTVADADCGVQFSPGEKAYRVEVLPGQPESAALGTVLNNVDLVVDSVHNPKIRLLTRTDVYDIYCTQYAFGGCISSVTTLLGSQCAVAANLSESGSRLDGTAEPLNNPHPIPPLNFGGDIRLTILD